MYVTTFYSFKGGVGRTLALLNVAYELADAGLQVLVVDFDLEAPAIHPKRWDRAANQVTTESMDLGSSHPGMVEYVGEYLKSMCVPGVSDYITEATPKECHGKIALMPSGILDDSYGHRLNGIDWNELYTVRDGYVMFEDLRAQWENLGFDYVLLDSRTGFTDVGGICTRHLPDAVVTMFRPDDQSLRGMEGIIELIRDEKPTPRRENPIQLHFVMAAIPDADDEEGILEERRATFQRRLRIPTGRLLEIRHFQSMDLLTQPIYTDIRPRTRLAQSFQELARRIRAFNIEDRNGILDCLRGETPELLEQGEERFLDRIRQRYDSDAGVLGQLANTHSTRGAILEAADLLERVAMLGPLTSGQWLRLAHARILTREREAALEAIKSFFQQPPDPASGEDESRYGLVRRGLNLLETAGANRVPYVKGSPIIQGLAHTARAAVAYNLDLSPDERRVAIKLLKDVLKSDYDPPEVRAGWKWNLAFARMAVGDFAPARAYFESELAETMSQVRVATAFNLAMALWAESGVPDLTAFKQVVEFFDAEDDKTWIDNEPNKLQALAVAEWLGDRPTEANRLLDEAERAIRGRRNDTSCWSYTRVSPDTFIADCREIRKLVSGEDVRPKFMRLDEAFS